MIFKPEHSIELIDIDNEVDLPIILNPSYVYKVEETFKLTNIMNEEAPIETWQVVSIDHEIRIIADGEQNIVMKVKKIDEEKKK